MNRVWIVMMVRTTHNETLWLEKQNKHLDKLLKSSPAEGDTDSANSLVWDANELVAAFATPEEACRHAIENEWFPFTVESVSYLSQGEL